MRKGKEHCGHWTSRTMALASRKALRPDTNNGAFSSGTALSPIKSIDSGRLPSGCPFAAASVARVELVGDWSARRWLDHLGLTAR